MKFPVDKCENCGLDLTTAEPAEVNYLSDKMTSVTCPNCLKPYWMEVTPVEAETEAEPKGKGKGKGKGKTEPAPEPEPEPETPPEE